MRGLASHDCQLRVLENSFLDHFMKEAALSSFLWILEPVQCLDLLPSHVKYYLDS